MKRKIRKSFVFCLASLLLLASCKKDLLSDMTLAGHQALDAYQLATAEIGIQNILGATADSAALATSTLIFTSEGELSTANGNALFPLSDQSHDYSFALSLADINTLTSIGSLQKNYSDTVTLQIAQQALIKNIKFRAGQLRIRYSTNCKHDNTFTLTVPMLKQAGIALSHRLDVSYTGIFPAEQEAVIDLTGYTLNLAFNGAVPSNRFYYTLTDSMTYIGNSLQIDDSTHMTLSFTGLEFSNIDGNFGTLQLPLMQQSFPLAIFQNVASGSLRFKAPVLNLTMRNSMGMPMTLQWDQITGQSPITGSHALVGDTLTRDWAFGVPGSKGKTAIRTIKLNAANTNLPEMLSHASTSILLSGRDSVRQVANTYTYFLTDSSSAGVDAQLQMPLEGSFEDLLLSDTLSIRTDAFKDEAIKALRLYVENRFPLLANIQAWPLDASGGRGEALLTEEGFTIPSGKIKSGGAVSDPTIVAQTIPISSTQSNQLLQAGRLLIGVKMKSDSGTDVKLSTASKIKIYIGVQAAR